MFRAFTAGTACSCSELYDHHQSLFLTTILYNTIKIIVFLLWNHDQNIKQFHISIMADEVRLSQMEYSLFEKSFIAHREQGIILFFPHCS